MPDALRVVSSSDGSTELHVRGPWLLVWILFFLLLALMAAFGLAARASAIAIAGWITALSVLFLVFLSWHDGANLSRVWRFAPRRITCEVRLPLQARLWLRQFSDVTEFEIVHTLWTTGIFSRGLHGGHEDTLRFGTSGSGRRTTLIERRRSESSATLWGGLFTQEHAGEIEREILPDVLAVAALASSKVGVPLYVIEKTFWVGSDFDG